MYIVQDSEVNGFLLFMKKKFHSWTIAGLFLSFRSHNFDVHQKCRYCMSCVLWCTVYVVWCIVYGVCGMPLHSTCTGYSCLNSVLCMMVYGVCVFVCHLYCTAMVLVYCMLVLIRRIVRNCIYCLILWHRYQSILYVSTRNKIFEAVVLPVVVPYAQSNQFC